MSVSLSSVISKPFSNSQIIPTSTTLRSRTRFKLQRHLLTLRRCQVNVNDQSSSSSGPDNYAGKTRNKDSSSSSSSSKLGIGSPVIITEAPKMIKTAASVPCLRVNADLVKPGDVGRIVSRKPMDVWAIRLSIGTYLIDRKYFEPLELKDE